MGGGWCSASFFFLSPLALNDARLTFNWKLLKGNFISQLSNEECVDEKRARRTKKKKKTKRRQYCWVAAVPNCYLFFYCAMFLARSEWSGGECCCVCIVVDIVQTVVCFASADAYYLFRPNFCFFSVIDDAGLPSFSFLLYSIFASACELWKSIYVFPFRMFACCFFLQHFVFGVVFFSLWRLRLCGDDLAVCFYGWFIHIYTRVRLYALVADGGRRWGRRRRRQMLRFHIINTDLFECRLARTNANRVRRLSKWDANLFIRSLIFNCRLKASVSRVPRTVIVFYMLHAADILRPHLVACVRLCEWVFVI